MVDYISPIVNQWIWYVFGTPLIAGIVILFFLSIWGAKRNWSIGMYVVTFIPMVFLLSISVLPQGLEPILLITMGLIIGLAMLKVYNR